MLQLETHLENKTKLPWKGGRFIFAQNKSLIGIRNDSEKLITDRCTRAIGGSCKKVVR